MTELPPKLRNALVEELVAAFDKNEFGVVLGLFGTPPDEVASTEARRSELVLAAILEVERKGTLLHFLEAAAAQRYDRGSLQRTLKLLRDHLRDRDCGDLSNALAEILQEQAVPAPTIVRLYRAVAPRLIRYERFETSLDVAFTATALLAAHGNRLPLIAFALLLPRQLGNDCRLQCTSALDRWVEEAYERLALTDEEKHRVESLLREGEERLAQTHVHLVISVAPVRTELPVTASSEYFISAWRMHVDADGKNDDIQSVAFQERSIAMQLERDITAVVDRFVAELGTDDRLTIELFLPIRLLTIPADQWMPACDEYELAAPLGTKHMVVLRSWDRAHRWRPQQRQDWMQLWKWRKRGQSMGMLANAADIDQQKFPATLRLKKTSCVALTFTPNDDALRIVVLSGTPIAVWLRCELPQYESDIGTLFDRLLATHHGDWREEIIEARLQAVAGTAANHFGRHLAVFWDDPERMPPDSD